MIDIDYSERNVVSERILPESGRIQRIVLVRHKTNAQDNYFLNSYDVAFDGEENLQGYMYFQLSPQTKTSSYIGTYVNYKYRNSGVAQLLNATWIDFCLDAGVETLRTIKHQRKPFLLYLLKGYSFEIRDLSKYEGKSIHICRGHSNHNKFLLFDNPSQRKMFEASKIYQQDSYSIVDEIGSLQEVGKVVLNVPYFLTDPEVAYQKIKQVQSK